MEEENEELRTKNHPTEEEDKAMTAEPSLAVMAETNSAIHGKDATSAAPEPKMAAERNEASANRPDPLQTWTRPPREECPICFIPLPLDPAESRYWGCCGNYVCCGCVLSQTEASCVDDREKVYICPFCRHVSDSPALVLEQDMKRSDAGKPEAIFRIGQYHFQGEYGLEQDKEEGIKWFQRSLDAGDGKAAGMLGSCYSAGNGVGKDLDKALEYYEKAAEKEHVLAYASIGRILLIRGEYDEAVLNYRKSSMCGVTNAKVAHNLRALYTRGYMTKEEYAFTLREHQAACNEMKSEAREACKKFGLA